MEYKILTGFKSCDLFCLVPDAEQVTGLSLKECLEYEESPEDAYIFGLVNQSNELGNFIFINLTRLAWVFDTEGVPGVAEILAHEALHLAVLLSPLNTCTDYKDLSELDEESLADACGRITQELFEYFLPRLY